MFNKLFSLLSFLLVTTISFSQFNGNGNPIPSDVNKTITDSVMYLINNNSIHKDSIKLYIFNPTLIDVPLRNLNEGTDILIQSKNHKLISLGLFAGTLISSEIAFNANDPQPFNVSTAILGTASIGFYVSSLIKEKRGHDKIRVGANGLIIPIKVRKR